MISTIIRLAITIIASGCYLITLWNLNLHQQVSKQIYEHYYDVLPVPVGILLGASVRSDKEASPVLLERIHTAALLYHQKKIQKILVSGHSSAKYYNEVKIMKKVLLENGVPEQNLILDGKGFRTYDSIFRAKNVFAINEALIITQSYHLSRSIFLANSLGLKVHGIPANMHQLQPTWKNKSREFFATYLAFADLWLFRTKPDSTK